MSTFEDLAAKMFGETTHTGQPTASTPTNHGVDADVANKMFPNQQQSHAAPAQSIKHEPTTLEEKAKAMFAGTDPTQTHRDATQAIVNSALEDHLHDPETAGQIAGEWAETFAKHNLNATESKELADIGAQVLKSPPTPELVATWTETAINQLQTEYGVKGAGQALQDARAYVTSVPGAADMIDALGLGAHPKLVALAAARGRAMRLAGKLR